MRAGGGRRGEVGRPRGPRCGCVGVRALSMRWLDGVGREEARSRRVSPPLAQTWRQPSKMKSEFGGVEPDGEFSEEVYVCVCPFVLTCFVSLLGGSECFLDKWSHLD